MRNADLTRSHRLASVFLAALLWTGAPACHTESQPSTAGGPGSPGSSGAGAEDAPDPTAEQVRIGGVLWYVDYDAALAVAREQDKALWVHFGENPG